MAALVDPRHASARHQSMHHFVARAPWDADALIAVARDYVLSAMERHAPVGAWILDDTGIPKKGDHSVGVARQYCGIHGKTDNCQAVVSLSLANETMSVPCAYRLYLPREWAEDSERRLVAQVPAEVAFQEKWRIALAQIEYMLAQGLPRAPVVADAGYGDITEFREGITALGLSYALGVKGETTVWPPGKEPLAPRRRGRRGRPPKRLRRHRRHCPSAIAKLAASLPDEAWHTVVWREGTKGAMRSKFAALRVRPAHQDFKRTKPYETEWLLIEWLVGAERPTKFWLCTAPPGADLEDLVRLVKLRWRIERDDEELKDEIGLDHYEGRNWLGFHHHGALCIAAYAFLVAERARLSPPQPLAFLKAPPVPKGFRPRGSPAAP
jgi:SRSO17 transposase